MNYLDFRKNLIDYKVFSIEDIRKLFPGFDTKRLVEWQRKGYIRKLINKWYLFTEIATDEMLLYRISNCLYQPSYVSLESALSYYNLIPEGVYSIQAVSTLKTITYNTPAGTFNYRNLKPGFFFGYTLLRTDNLPVRVAEIEKALLDYLYLNASLQSSKDIEALRLNFNVLHDAVDWKKLENYSLIFKSRTLDKRIRYLKKIISHVVT